MTLFYLDSNVYGVGGSALNHTIYRRLVNKYPDCLIIPEWSTPYDWASTASYRHMNLGMLGTPASVRGLYPDAFSVLNVADQDFALKKNALIEAVRSGDVLLFRAWWQSPELHWIDAIYTEARR